MEPVLEFGQHWRTSWPCEGGVFWCVSNFLPFPFHICASLEITFSNRKSNPCFPHLDVSLFLSPSSFSSLLEKLWASLQRRWGHLGIFQPYSQRSNYCGRSWEPWVTAIKSKETPGQRSLLSSRSGWTPSCPREVKPEGDPLDLYWWLVPWVGQAKRGQLVKRNE